MPTYRASAVVTVRVTVDIGELASGSETEASDEALAKAAAMPSSALGGRLVAVDRVEVEEVVPGVATTEPPMLPAVAPAQDVAPAAVASGASLKVAVNGWGKSAGLSVDQVAAVIGAKPAELYAALTDPSQERAASCVGRLKKLLNFDPVEYNTNLSRPDDVYDFDGVTVSICWAAGRVRITSDKLIAFVADGWSSEKWGSRPPSAESDQRLASVEESRAWRWSHKVSSYSRLLFAKGEVSQSAISSVEELLGVDLRGRMQEVGLPAGRPPGRTINPGSGRRPGSPAAAAAASRTALPDGVVPLSVVAAGLKSPDAPLKLVVDLWRYHAEMSIKDVARVAGTTPSGLHAATKQPRRWRALSGKLREMAAGEPRPIADIAADLSGGAPLDVAYRAWKGWNGLNDAVVSAALGLTPASLYAVASGQGSGEAHGQRVADLWALITAPSRAAGA